MARYNFYDDDPVVPEWVKLVLVGIALILALVFCVNTVDSMVCTSTGSQMGMPARYDIFTGCFISPEEGKWIPLDSYYYEGQKPGN